MPAGRLISRERLLMAGRHLERSLLRQGPRSRVSSLLITAEAGPDLRTSILGRKVFLHCSQSRWKHPVPVPSSTVGGRAIVVWRGYDEPFGNSTLPKSSATAWPHALVFRGATQRWLCCCAGVLVSDSVVSCMPCYPPSERVLSDWR